MKGSSSKRFFQLVDTYYNPEFSETGKTAKFNGQEISLLSVSGFCHLALYLWSHLCGSVALVFSVLFLNGIPLYKHSTVYSSTLLLMDFGYVQFGASITNAL
jgi:hypothetical protein